MWYIVHWSFKSDIEYICANACLFFPVCFAIWTGVVVNMFLLNAKDVFETAQLASLVLLTEMNFHADARWDDFTNIILCSSHLWYLYYFHDGKMGHFDDLLLYNAKTISHLLVQRISQELLLLSTLQKLMMFLKCLLMFYCITPEWPCHENTQKSAWYVQGTQVLWEFGEGKSDFSFI